MSMSLDFANEAFFTVASCSCVCADGCEVSNLLSKDASKRVQGFQGERFVRTPATMQFQFYVPVSIQKIEFTPFFGRQCAKVIGLHTSDSYPLAEKGDPGGLELRNKEDNRFRKSGTLVLTHQSKAGFVNRGYKLHPKLPLPPTDKSATVAFTNGNLGFITALRIVIQNMLEGSIPSLSSLHIWGRPARRCPSEKYKEVIRINETLNSTAEIKLDVRIRGSSSTNETLVKDGTDPNENTDDIAFGGRDDVPTEFIDPLTCELMRMPVLLPSGHTVDRSSLDKHVRSQSEMGNVPSDPFTGIPLTDRCKPRPNVKLKVRMDDYFFKSTELGDCNRNVDISRKRLLTSTFAESHSHKNIQQDLGSHDHFTALSSSLDVALASVRKSPKRRKLVINNESGASGLYCSKCNIFLSSTVTQYQLPCLHAMCYNCMRDPATRSQGVTCPTCRSFCEFKSIARVHG